VDWINLAQDRDNWRAFMETVMNILFLYKTGSFFSRGENISLSLAKLIQSNNM